MIASIRTGSTSIWSWFRVCESGECGRADYGIELFISSSDASQPRSGFHGTSYGQDRDVNHEA